MTEHHTDRESLRQLLGGYFHQDFIAQYGSVDAAARAYRAEASVDERARAARQLSAVLAASDSLEELRDAFAKLRSGWRPRDRRSVERVLAIIED